VTRTARARGLRGRPGWGLLGLATLVAVVGLAAGGFAPAARADDEGPPPLRVGDTMPELRLEDQHGAARVVDAATRAILFSRDMDGGDLLKSALEALPEGTLDRAPVVYVADISGMPGLVTRLFALPSMRRRPYPMLLDRTGEATELLPDVEGRATVIHLEDLRITQVEHLDRPEAVRARIAALAGIDPDAPEAADRAADAQGDPEEGDAAAEPAEREGAAGP